VFFDEVSQREQLNALTSYIDASMIYGNDDDDGRNLRDFASGRGLLRTSPSASQSQKPLLPPNQGEFIDCQVSLYVTASSTGLHRRLATWSWIMGHSRDRWEDRTPKFIWIDHSPY